MTEIKDNYDIPTDLKFVSRPWYGLSWKEAIVTVSAIIVAYAWYKLYSVMCLPEVLFTAGIVVIGLLALGIIVLHLDMWMYYAVKWAIEPYYVTKFDTAAKQVSGITGVSKNHYWNVDGELCAMMRMTAINSDRVDPAKADRVEKADKDFLNSLPCPIQIVGYTYDYDVKKYIDQMLSCAEGLPESVIKYRVAHLNFYREYIADKNIRERMLYLIIKVGAQTANAEDTIDTYASIITKNLLDCGVLGSQMSGQEIRDAMLMVATGIGERGADYTSPYTEVDAK